MSGPEHVETIEPPAPIEGDVRLDLTTGGRTGHVDGSWWPRSRDLAAELPALTARIGEQLGPVERIAYHRSSWDPSDRRRLRTATGQTSLDGFDSVQPDAVWISVGGRPARRLWLVVIPPDTPPARAAAVRERASAPGNRESVTDLLHADGADGPGRGAPAPTTTVAPPVAVSIP